MADDFNGARNVPDAQDSSASEPIAPAPAAQRFPKPKKPQDEFRRAPNEDDDGYDPWSDRRPDPEPLYERDPWR